MTTTDRIDERLSSARSAGRCALLPYFTSGFPDQATTAELIVAAEAVGASVVELGVPYSDSIADGPVIQSSFNYALARGHRVGDVFDVVREVRGSVGCALTVMLSYSIVYRVGVERFMERAADAGFDGIILPDVPQEEAGPTSAAARSAGLCHIGLIAPTTSAARGGRTPHPHPPTSPARSPVTPSMAVRSCTYARSRPPAGCGGRWPERSSHDLHERHLTSYPQPPCEPGYGEPWGLLACEVDALGKEENLGIV